MDCFTQRKVPVCIGLEFLLPNTESDRHCQTNTNNGCCCAGCGCAAAAAADLILNCDEHSKLVRLPGATLPLFAGPTSVISTSQPLDINKRRKCPGNCSVISSPPIDILSYSSEFIKIDFRLLFIYRKDEMWVILFYSK